MSRAGDLVREMDLLRGLQKGELNIGVGIYPGAMFVDKAVGRLIREHPAAQICLAYQNAYDLLPRLVSRELDLTVMYMRNRNDVSQFHITGLKQHTLYFVTRAGHPLLRQHKKLSLAEVLQYPLATVSQLPPSTVKPLRFSIPKGYVSDIKSVPSIRCDSVAIMKVIVAESDAVAILPLNAVRLELENGTMGIPLDEPAARGNFSIVRLQCRSLSPLGERFVQFVKEADSEMAQFEQQFVFKKPRKG